MKLNNYKLLNRIITLKISNQNIKIQSYKICKTKLNYKFKKIQHLKIFNNSSIKNYRVKIKQYKI